MTDIEIIRNARARLDTDEGKRDWGLAVYMVRDLQATKELGWYDIARSLVENPCSYREAVWLLEALTRAVEHAYAAKIRDRDDKRRKGRRKYFKLEIMPPFVADDGSEDEIEAIEEGR